MTVKPQNVMKGIVVLQRAIATKDTSYHSSHIKPALVNVLKHTFCLLTVMYTQLQSTLTGSHYFTIILSLQLVQTGKGQWVQKPVKSKKL